MHGAFRKFKFSLKYMYAAFFILICVCNLFCIAYQFVLYHKDKMPQTGYNGSEYICAASADPALGVGDLDEESNENSLPFQKIIHKIDSYAENHSICFDEMTQLGATLKRVTGLSPEFVFLSVPTVVEMSNGLFSYVYDDEGYADYASKVNNVIAFSQYLEKNDAEMLFVETPIKFDSNLYNGFYEDYTGEMGEKICNDLRNAGIPVISIEEEIKKQNLDKAALFFKTDHHWLPQTGIWANRLLSEKLNETFGYNIDTALFDKENYNIEILKNSFFGSHGKKVTFANAQKEDFPIVTPKYKTDLTVFNSYDGSTKTGSLEETLLDYTKIAPENLQQIMDNYTYGFYGYGDQALIKIHNNQVSDGRHILMIKASFADVMYPFLAAGVENLDVLDLRHFKGSLRAYIQETKPDTVVFIYGASLFSEQSGNNTPFVFN